MNIAPISVFSNVSNRNLGKRCLVQNTQPAPETQKDEVSFKGYNEFIREAATKRYMGKLQCENLFFELFEKLINPKYAKTVDFRKFRDLYEHKSLHNTLKAIAGEKFSLETEPLAEELFKKSQKGDVVLANCDGIPVFTLHTNEMPNFLERTFYFKPDNIAELQINTPLGFSGCIFGLNPHGELTLKQLSFMDLPKYTSFHNSNGKVKVFTSGRYDEGNFTGQYFNHDGSYNPFLSMLLH